ncbi:MAG: cyclodeaminase/cyclohydrolase family protein, partial [Candidatus Hodarchaeales archaeon]
MTEKLIKLTVNKFSEVLASSSPAPGGGSAAALASTLGADLGAMVMQLTIGKEKFKNVEELAKKYLTEMNELRAALLTAVDEDTLAFNDVMKAFKMPKDTDEQKQARSQAIQEGYKKASEVPYRSAELSMSALKIIQGIIQIGNPNAISDCGVGALLLHAGLKGAIYNIKINLGSIKDKNFVIEMKTKI